MSPTGQLTSSGRVTGSTNFEDFECSVPKRIPPTEENLLAKITELQAALKAANVTISDQIEKIGEKDIKIFSLARRLVDLERRNAELEEELGKPMTHLISRPCGQCSWDLPPTPHKLCVVVVHVDH